MIAWDCESPPDTAIEIDYVPHFNARGMRPVYGRGDYFPSGRSFNMDLWLDRSGRLLVRFWSRSTEVDGRSLQVSGISPAIIPAREKNVPFSDAWIPKALREEYERWISEEF